MKRVAVEVRAARGIAHELRSPPQTLMANVEAALSRREPLELQLHELQHGEKERTR